MNALDLDIDLPVISREIFLRDAGKLFRKQLYRIIASQHQHQNTGRRVGRSHHHHHHRLYLGQDALLVCVEKSHAILVGVAGSATVNQPLHTSNNIAGLVVDLGDLRPETLPQSKPLVELLLQRKS